ncbi:MAG: FAD-binding oxidoreductase [Promethearchaeota archaeon]
MSIQLEQFLQLKNINYNKIGSLYQVNVIKKEEILELLAFSNSEHIPLYFNYSDKFDVKPQSQETAYIFLNFNNFNEICEKNIANRYVVVEPRVKASYLNEILKNDNFIFLPFSGNEADINIGQMIFNNLIGDNQVKTSDSILGLEVILPNGDIIRTGSKTLKSVSGYDITSLFIGSKGIFGIIIKATLRIDPIISQSEDKTTKMNPPTVQSNFDDEEIKFLQNLKSVVDPENILNRNYLI